MPGTQLNLTQAAQAAGITRRTLYNHIKQGKISTSRDKKNNPVIEVAELIRVYRNLTLPEKKLPGDSHRENTHKNYPHEQLKTLQREVAELRQAVTLMLEDKTARESERRLFDEERRTLQEEISRLNDRLERQQKKGLWARLRGGTTE
ncbi:entry exclusion protein 1 [Enterobacter sp. PTB]|uniref:entry exclusion protein 1 n=1 Tax=Enterobacter sp. PTB TaxID=3143437 RepID=UPI003DA8B31D